MAIEVFNRFEHKYLITQEQLDRLLPIIDKHMAMDKYCLNHSTYTIANLYYDTDDNMLIRKSLERPQYKEKLRLRAYGIPGKDSFVFLEIKKKFKKCVNKRRTTLKLDEAYSFCETGAQPEHKDYMNAQVCNEIEYFIKHYNVVPKVYIAYDRLAYFEAGNPDLRISFDTNIRTRRTDLSLEAGDHGMQLLPDGRWLMEIKTSRAKPLWLCDALTEIGIKRISFSKYGTEYRHMLTEQFKEAV